MEKRRWRREDGEEKMEKKKKKKEKEKEKETNVRVVRCEGSGTKEGT
jgi:hypothetical protein